MRSAGNKTERFGNTQDDYDNAFAFGCTAVLNTINAARPVMVTQGGGRIVNIVTELWDMAPSGWYLYMAGKGAMVGHLTVAGLRTRAGQPRVNMVAPGWMAGREGGH